MKFRELKLRRDPACPIRGDNPTIKELIDYDQFCGIQPAPAEPVGNPDEVTLQDMKKALDNPSRRIQFNREIRQIRELGRGDNRRTPSLG